MRTSTSDALGIAITFGSWLLKGIAFINLMAAITLFTHDLVLLALVFGALAILQYIAAYFLRAEVRTLVIPFAMVATAISVATVWRPGGSSSMAPIMMIVCIVLVTAAWLKLPDR